MQTGFLHPPRNIIESSVSTLFTIPYCSLSRESGPYCISDTAVHPLRAAKDRRLGGLLTHQLPNLTKAEHSAIKSLLYQGCASTEVCSYTFALVVRTPLFIKRSTSMYQVSY